VATFEKDFVESYPSLADFAREDGCIKIYKAARQPGGPQDLYITIRSPQDEVAMRSSGSVHNPQLVWQQ
jgi:hypothetical protein